MENKYVKIWDWIRDNRLSLEVLSDYDNCYQLRLRNQFGHILINDSGTIRNDCGKGLTFEEAFEDMLNIYSNKILFNQILDEGKVIKTTYKFPNIDEVI